MLPGHVNDLAVLLVAFLETVTTHRPRPVTSPVTDFSQTL